MYTLNGHFITTIQYFARLDFAFNTALILLAIDSTDVDKLFVKSETMLNE